MTSISLGWAGVGGKKHDQGDGSYVSGVGCGQKMQEECEIRLTRASGLGSIAKVAKEIGRIAQLGERCPYKAEVTGSIPVPPTRSKAGLRGAGQVVERK
jgi:hypothetical protein